MHGAMQTQPTIATPVPRPTVEGPTEGVPRPTLATSATTEPVVTETAPPASTATPTTQRKRRPSEDNDTPTLSPSATPELTPTLALTPTLTPTITLVPTQQEIATPTATIGRPAVLPPTGAVAQPRWPVWLIVSLMFCGTGWLLRHMRRG